MGGRTPNASAVSMTIVFACPPMPLFTKFGKNETGYAERVFSVFDASSTSSRRVFGSSATFSRTVPKRCEAAQISGSCSSRSLIIFA